MDLCLLGGDFASPLQGSEVASEEGLTDSIDNVDARPCSQSKSHFFRKTHARPSSARMMRHRGKVL